MNWQWNPFALLPLICGLVAINLVFRTRPYLNLKGARRVIALLTLAALWNLGYCLELLRTDLAWMVALRTIQFAGMVFLPGLMLTYVMSFTGLDNWLTRKILIGLFILPVAALSLALTNNLHNLVWTSSTVVQHQEFVYLSVQGGFGEWVFWPYVGFVTLVTVSLLVIAAIRAPRLYLRHNSVLIFAAIFPYLHTILDHLDIFNLPYYHSDTAAAAFSVVILRISLTRFIRNDLTAASRAMIFDSLDNGIFVINRLGQMIDVNAYGWQLLGREKKALLGRLLLDFIPELASTKFFRALPGIDQLQWLVRGEKTYKVHFNPIKDGQGQVLGSVVSLSDLSTVVQQASDLNVILKTAQQVFSTLDLREVLVRFAEIALEISGYHRCLISEWDREKDTTSVLVELSRAVFAPDDGNRNLLVVSPTTKRVLLTGLPVRISVGDEDPENTWMVGICVSHLLMVPLFAGMEVVGVIDICRIDVQQPFSIEEEAQAYLQVKGAAGQTEGDLFQQAENLYELAMELSKSVQADLVTISKWDRDRDEIVSVSEYSTLSWNFNQGPEHQTDRRLTISRALKEGLVTNTFRSDPEISPEELGLMKRWGMMSMVVLPLAYQGERIGLLELNHMGEEKKINQNKLRLLGGIAEHASISIQNARLHRETEKKLREQLTLKEASQVISSSLELDTVLNRLTEQLAKAVDATSAYLLTYDRLKNTITVVAEYYSAFADPLELVSDLGDPYDDEASWFDMIDRGIQHRISHYDDPGLPENERNHLQAFGARSVLYIPIRYMGSVLGHAEIWESRRKREFTPEEISLCQAISLQAGSAIEHAIRFEQTQHDATHDVLTSLPNRAMLIRRLELAIQRGRRRPELKFALVYLDLDGFKIVNDSMGHIAGDEFLREIARRLEQVTRKVDTVSRFGGDEFAILMEDIQDVHNVIRLVERIRQEISRPVILQKNEIVVTASTGIVISSDEYSSTMEYLRDADIAMYRAKRQGKARFEVFNQQMRLEVSERLKMEQELRAAYEQGQFVYYYQPVYRLADRAISGVEAFLRWNHPERGLLPPSAFIQVAEETGILYQVTNDLLRDALQQLSAWQKHLPNGSGLSLSVNISGKQLSQPGFLYQVEEILRESGVPGELVHFEVTERSILEDFKASELVLNQIKALGVRIYLDDFGTGYSSLNYLRQLSADLVKIDHSLINQLPEEIHSSLCRTILQMARELGFKVIAEGVETEAQRQILLELGCEFGQGFLFGQPLDAANIERVLRDSLRIETTPPGA